MWQKLTQTQDDFVISLLKSKQEYLAGILPVVAPLNGAASAEATQEIERLQQEVLRLRQNLAGQAASRQANGPEADSLDASFHNAHLKEEIDNPCAMVFLDGTKTIFNDALIGQGKTGAQSAASQLQWEVTKDLRQYEGMTSENDPKVLVVCWIFIDRVALVSSLIKSQAITSASTFAEFYQAFNALPNFTIVDIGSTPAHVKAASMISLFGRAENVSQIYLAGLNTAALVNVIPSLTPNFSPYSPTSSKIVLVNYSESDDEEVILGTSGWRVVTFAGLFEEASMSWNVVAPREEVAAAPEPARRERGERGGRDRNDRADKRDRSDARGGREDNGRAPMPALGPGQMKLNPNRAFLNQDPQVCVFHYLSKCGSPRDCRRSHDYQLSPGQLTRLRADVAKSPCKEMRTTGTCRWAATNGSRCMYNHVFTRQTEGDY